MKLLLASLVTGFIQLALGAGCEGLPSLKLKDARVTSAKAVAAGTFTPLDGGSNAVFRDVPAFCRVEVVAQPSQDSHIEFEVWLPASGWNGKYFGIGNGGFAGSIQYSCQLL
jgi:feruloyl esterase